MHTTTTVTEGKPDFVGQLQPRSLTDILYGRGRLRTQLGVEPHCCRMAKSDKTIC
jgi:hypothetical protein